MGGATYPAFKATGRCAATGRELQPGETFIATLVERRDAGAVTLARMDFSLQAWDDGARPGLDTLLLGKWRTVLAPADRRSRPLLSDQDLLDMFEESHASGTLDERATRFRFVLALLLVRRRRLRVVSSRRESGRTVLSVVRRGDAALGATPIDVVDPGLDDSAVSEAVEQLLAMTEGEGGAHE